MTTAISQPDLHPGRGHRLHLIVIVQGTSQHILERNQLIATVRQGGTNGRIRKVGELDLRRGRARREGPLDLVESFAVRDTAETEPDHLVQW